MKILHLADLHLREADIEEATRCCDFIVMKADEESPNLIVIAGDAFDSQDLKLDTQSARLAIRTASSLALIAPVVIVRGTVSHDGNSPEILSLALGIGKVFVATKPTQLYLYDGNFLAVADEMDPLIDEDVEAVITLIPTPTKQFFQGDSDIKTADAEIAGAMSAMFAGFGAMAAKYKVPHILVGHWNTTGAYISEKQVLTGVDIEISVDQMDLANADLVCLGHIHKSQKLGKNIFYSGSPWALNWGEEYRHGFFMHIVCDGFLESEFIKTPATILQRYSFDATAGQNEYLFPSSGDPNTIVRVDITCWQDEAELIDKAYIYQELSWAKKVDIRINRVPRGNVRSEAILVAETLCDKVIARANLNGGPPSAAVLQKVKALEYMEPEALVAAVSKGGAL
jgi:DNA repair exonuclease SbcCD nuclease subunit